MNPLRVALIHYDNPRQYDRMVGYWSYAVPEFAVTHFGVAPGRQVYRRAEYARAGFDAIVWEDHKTRGTWADDAAIPLIYHVVDSTLSASHLEDRRHHGAQADLILVDHDRLERLGGLGVPVRRWGYCVNDRLFRDYGEEKTIDVAFHCRTKGSAMRAALRNWLAVYCARMGYTYASGDRDREEYARAFNRAKVAVNLTRTPQNRPHRVLDALACRTCLLSSKLPHVSGEERVQGVHYVEWDASGEALGANELGAWVERLLGSGEWQALADNGYELVHRAHTWAVRAGELRQILSEEFGL